MKHHLRPLLNILIPCYTISWLLSGCFGPVNKKLEVQITVQDSTGNPVSGFRLALLGIKQSYNRQDILERFDLTTDQVGKVSQALSWPKGITNYEISHTAFYVTCNCLPSKEIPAPYCHIVSDQTSSITIQVKKR